MRLEGAIERHRLDQRCVCRRILRGGAAAPIERAAKDYIGIRHSITGKELDIQKVKIARQEELDLMGDLDLMKGIPVDQGCLNTNA